MSGEPQGALKLAFSGISGRLRAVVTPLGWVMVVIIPLNLIIGYRFGWLELVAAGYACAVLVIIAASYLIGRNAFAISLTVPHRRFVVGEHAAGEITVANPTRRRLSSVKLEMPIGRGRCEITLPSLGRAHRFTHSFVVPTTHRGMLTVGPVRTIRADPIGLVSRELVWGAHQDVFIHPRTIAIPAMTTGYIRDLEGNPTRDLSSSDVSFHALREYAAGDERRFIHWKSTAKTGTFMVRQFEETRRSHLAIALSLHSADYANDVEFEMAVSVTGSLGVRAIRDARDISIVVSDVIADSARRRISAVRNLSTLTRLRLLDDLSLIEHSERSLSMVEIARVAAKEVAGVSVAFLICGSLASPSMIRAASARFAPGIEVIAVVCAPEHRPGLRRVAELSVLTIGYLEDLQKSLARAAGA